MKSLHELLSRASTNLLETAEIISQGVEVINPNLSQNSANELSLSARGDLAAKQQPPLEPLREDDDVREIVAESFKPSQKLQVSSTQKI